MPPLHRSPENGAQHIVYVIDGLGRVAFLCEMSDVHLDLLSRDFRKCLVTKPWQQVLLEHEATMLLRRVLVHREDRGLPIIGQCAERDQ